VLRDRATAPAREFQRNRIVAAMTQLACERGVSGNTVAQVIERAGVSRRTFYEHFEDRDACFQAALEQIVTEVAAQARPAYEAESRWAEQIRAGLQAVLEFLDESPDLARFCVVHSVACGPATLAGRGKVLASLERVVIEGAQTGREPPVLIARGVVGGALEIVHARLLDARTPQLLDLLNPLMNFILLPYLGPAAARRELARATPVRSRRRRARPSGDIRAQLKMRLTARTLRVLSAIAAEPGRSNREIGNRAGIADQGQICKLLTRLSKLGLIENTGAGHARGAANAWRLDTAGRELMLALGDRSPAE
jgi:AcrR family transcriptional regulator